MKTLLLVTMLFWNQPLSHYQVPFTSSQRCEAARIKLAEETQKIERALILWANERESQARKSGGASPGIMLGPITIAVCVEQ